MEYKIETKLVISLLVLVVLVQFSVQSGITNRFQCENGLENFSIEPNPSSFCNCTADEDWNSWIYNCYNGEHQHSFIVEG